MFTQGMWGKLLAGMLCAVFAVLGIAGTATAKVVKVDLDARITNVEVAPGVKMRAWTFNGSVPAPVVRATVGDTVEVTLTNSDMGSKIKCPKSLSKKQNKKKSKKQVRKYNKKRKNCRAKKRAHMGMAHSVDFHAAKIAPDKAFRSVLPGESITFSFEAKKAGVFMYHCGTGPMLEHIGMGMYGMIVVDPVVPRPAAKEIFIVQSEFYGKVKNGWLKSSYEAMQTEPPKYVTFNGTAMKYANDPIEVGVGEPVRLYFVDAGPSIFSSFHVVGSWFDEYQHDGNIDEPLHDVSTQVIGPGGGGVFEFTLPEAGRYPFVTHSILDMDKGAVGFFQAG
ncbi:MAG: multicopper oxidase domain-containing protein [Solirubrobacterales bacterium]|nr:multicopper oxidase domain-containing protein [Solirubrobacterales bacterium]